MSRMNLRGVFAPIPTPFDCDGRIDLDRLGAACAHWAAGPLDGIVVLGSTGEAALLDEAESDRVLAFARDRWPSGRPFIAGTGRESTRAAIDAARRAASLGADAVLVRTPGFYKSQMTTDAFVRHYTAVADASPVPVLLYNFTAVTGVNLLPAAVSKLSAHPNIVGVKESSGDIAQMTDLVAGTPDGFNVLAGSATTFYASMCIGAAGASSRSRACCPAPACGCSSSRETGATSRRPRCSAGWCPWRSSSGASTACRGSRPRSRLPAATPACPVRRLRQCPRP